MGFRTDDDRRAYNRAYEKRPEVKAKKRAYDTRPEVVAARNARLREYRKRPEVMEKLKAQMQVRAQRPEVKEMMRANQRAYNERHPDRRRVQGLAWKKRNPDKVAVNMEKQHAAAFHQRYGITVEERDILLAMQGGKCKICRHELTKRPQTDHCHKTGPVRGILCLGCNTGLGLFKEDPALLRAAATYLEAFNTSVTPP